MLNNYIAIYQGQEREIVAESLVGAKIAAVMHFKVPKSKAGLLGVYLVKLEDGTEISQHID